MNKLETQKSPPKKKMKRTYANSVKKRLQNNDVKMIKNLNKMEKIQESNNKDLEELKKTYIQRQTTQLLKLKIL